MQQEDLLSLEELTQILSIPRDTVAFWIEEGLLKPVPFGDSVRFRFEDVEVLVKKNLVSSERGYHILIIEDDALVGTSLKNFLEKSGYEVTVIPVGLAALDTSMRGSFDLLLTDVRMPGMNGIETVKAVRELRNQFGLPKLPEIIITAYEDEGVREEAARLGIADFILKPFELIDLISAIERNLKHAV